MDKHNYPKKVDPSTHMWQHQIQRNKGKQDPPHTLTIIKK